MSRSKEDELLEERIEKIRRKNEEIKRRHLEVEADKRHAAKLNALVQPKAPSEDWTSAWSAPGAGPRRQGAPPEQPAPEARRRRDLDGTDGQRTPKQNGKCYVFTEVNGPPPDPVYNFLADSEREPGREGAERRGSRQAGARGASGRPRGRERAPPHKEVRRNNHHAEYEAWRAERNRIDQDRINRQKTAEGLWRREWDNEKVTQDCKEDEGLNEPVSHPSQGRFASGRFNSAPLERDGESAKLPERNPPAGKRNICKVDGTLTISIANDASLPTTGSLQRVRVRPPAVVGSGRVGPRQKARASYSSQSEDEQHSPQRLSRAADPARSIVQTVRCNPASLRPPLPPGHSPGEGRQGRKRNMRGDCPKKEQRRTDSTGSSRGNDSEGAGDESWEDVTTSGTESACETSEDKAHSANKTCGDAVENVKSRPSAISGNLNGGVKTAILNEKPTRVNRILEAENLDIDGIPRLDTAHLKCLESADKPYNDDYIQHRELDVDGYFSAVSNKDVLDHESDLLDGRPVGGK
ncbi:coiled-coil domain-containing protein 9-like [Bacillus rossius redtenbacheri]|uniref:coiled-coil domain-containing protein 9-like n=1 Tax=Bacillus rossius redtenbacheri TaxID=93214 RepID=UPI002FDE573F